MAERRQRTIEEIRQFIRIARDSMWAVNNVIEKLNTGVVPNKMLHGELKRNVTHMSIVVADQEVISSGEDTSDLHAAIAKGEAKLAESIWPE